jgi:transposase
MSTEYFIALDVHCAFTEMAVVTSGGKLVRRERSATTIPALSEALDAIRRPRRLTFEEGPLAGWLARNLAEHTEELLVCDPRRNHLVANDGDKDDPIDAEKLAHLFRGGYLREVHQCDSLDRAVLKQHVGFYHDRVRERVRQGQQLVAQLKRHGVFAKIGELMDADQRRRIWNRLPRRKVLRSDLDRLWQIFELLIFQEEEIRAEVIQMARREEPVRRFEQLPGIGWIRAITFYVYIDTPWRFRNKSALWKYCGIGLERRRSGMGRTKVRLVPQANRRLKNILLGAAKSAVVRADNPFADKYHYWTKEEGLHPATARRNTARSLASTLWGLWKTGQRYDPAKVRGIGQSNESTDE